MILISELKNYSNLKIGDEVIVTWFDRERLHEYKEAIEFRARELNCNVEMIYGMVGPDGKTNTGNVQSCIDGCIIRLIA